MKRWLTVLLPAIACGMIFDAPAALAEADGTADTATALTATALGDTSRPKCRHYQADKLPFFGDLHVHTRYSLDASTQGTRTTPAQAYAFAKGAMLQIQPWMENGKAERSLQLERPLDFAMVSDHAELIGEVQMCNNEEEPGYGSWQCRLYRAMPRGAFYLFNYVATIRQKHMAQCGENAELCLAAAVKPWEAMRAAARDHYDRSDDCSFTTFVGYEWTGMESPGGNLHRNVVFLNDLVPDLPTSFIDAPDEEQLWDGLEKHCLEKTVDGVTCDTLVIPHNSNLSSGKMFTGTAAQGKPMTAEYAARRQRFEPQFEIMQHKGASECFYQAGISADELCAFERLPVDNISGMPYEPKPDTGFAREALAKGMRIAREVGVNPYQAGFIASTDTHLGAPGAVEEGVFLGHGGAGVPALKEVPPGLPDKLEYGPGGLAVVWAPENTREALFDGLRRRETYGTSGPRIVSRFFAGWDLPATLCEDPERIAHAYEQGVPMGSELKAVTAADAKPRFLIAAAQDVGTQNTPGNPLQRVQLIKVSLDAAGERQEQVIDVVGDANNGASVDLRSCETRGSGFGQLCTVWTDEAFDPKQQAYYYTRVLENPSCRWSQRICVANKVDCSDPDTVGEGLEGCCAPEHRPVIQERAWSSPIWYTPPGIASTVVPEPS